MPVYKIALSPTAKLIFEQYKKDTKGGESFMTETIKMAMLAGAMQYIMSVQQQADPNVKASRYTDAYREVAKFLFPDYYA